MIELDDVGLVARRSAAAVRLLADDPASAARIADAPAGYILAHDSSDIARHCALLSTAMGAGEVRVVATPGRALGAWHLDVAARDRPGLLAAFTGVLAARRTNVVQAVLATWDDGGALEAFVVRSSSPPDVGELQAAFEASLDQQQSSPAIGDAEVLFDGELSAVYTACEIRAADRPGLLHAFAVAIAAAGADVHAAKVTTIGGVAIDRFDLSDADGHKLGPTLEAAICAHVRDGVAPAARRRRWFTRRSG